MYSLYRAWFGDASTTENYPRLQESLSPPDTVVRVGNEGEHQFVAHKGVLAAHSGYLKALLASAAATSSSSVNSDLTSCNTLPSTAIALAASNGQSQRQPVTSVSVSSIGGEAFAPLLNYMYTGRLEVTLDNVYSVLLATHLLHMPGALEQCRAALLRLRGPPHLPTPISMTGPTSTPTTTTSIPTSVASSNILRPIPNRLMVGPSMCWPPPTPLYPPTGPVPGSVAIPHLPQLQPSVLLQSTLPPSLSLIPTSSSMHEVPNSSQYGRMEVASPKTSPSQTQRTRISRVDSRSRSPESGSSTSLPFVAAAAAAAAAFSAFAASSVATSTRIPSPSQSSSPTPSSVSHSPTLLRPTRRLISSEGLRNKEDREEEEDINTSRMQQTHHRRSSSAAEESINQNRENTAETVSQNENDRGRSRRRGRVGSSSGSADTNTVLSVVYDVACCDGPVRFQRVLNENYTSTTISTSNPIVYTRLPPPPVPVPVPVPVPAPAPAPAPLDTEGPASSESDENNAAAAKPAGACELTESGSATTTASYTCEYCRHTFKSQYCYKKHAKRHLLPARMNESSSCASRQQRPEGPRNRREVKLLDLNVQYYPCKICGCKFPSYYFVHKHRKLCHANVDDRSQTGSTTSSASHEQESVASTISDAPRD